MRVAGPGGEQRWRGQRRRAARAAVAAGGARVAAPAPRRHDAAARSLAGGVQQTLQTNDLLRSLP